MLPFCVHVPCANTRVEPSHMDNCVKQRHFPQAKLSRNPFFFGHPYVGGCMSALDATGYSR